MKPITSSSATGSFIPDSPSSERASRFSRVERRSTAKIAAESVAAIAAPTSSPSQGAEAEDPASRRSPAITAVTTVPDRRQRGGGAEHRADLRPARGETALEEDQDERDRAQRPRQLGVVEVDPADPLASRPASPARGRAAGPGTRTRSASRAPTIPAASRTPAIRIRSASCPGRWTALGRASSVDAASCASSSAVEPAWGTSSGRSCGWR